MSGFDSRIGAQILSAIEIYSDNAVRYNNSGNNFGHTTIKICVKLRHGRV